MTNANDLILKKYGITPCTNHGCIFDGGHDKKGMGTCSWCKCVIDRPRDVEKYLRAQSKAIIDAENKVPESVLHLCAFMCETWELVDSFVYEFCHDDSIDKYPVVQGTRMQINLAKIATLKYDDEKIYQAVEWILENKIDGGDDAKN